MTLTVAWMLVQDVLVGVFKKFTRTAFCREYNVSDSAVDKGGQVLVIIIKNKKCPG